jgi:hypothetical protein
MSKLAKPVPSVDGLKGRKSYAGSISSMAGGELTSNQRRAILAALKESPKFPSGLVIYGLSPFSVHHQQGLNRYLSDLGASGFAEFSGKKGWSLTESGVAHLKGLECKEE